MTAQTALPTPALGRRNIEPSLLLLAIVAWIITIVLATDMRVGPGTMGLNVIAFLGTWALMMAAMMFPSIAPFTSLYTRTFTGHRARRIALLAGGYLSVWTATGLAAFGLAAAADRLAERQPGWAQGVAVASCFACAIYQMTPLKETCLQHCRSPLGHLLHYASFKGPLADLRVGLSHGAWCLGCCWSLMVLLVTFGVMNLVAMAVLAAVIITEKVVAPGRWFSIAIGLVALGLGIAIWIDPSIARGLYLGSEPMMDM